MTDLPTFSGWAQNQRLLNMIENYIGLPVAFQGIHLRRDFANERPVTTELWHKDLEDRRVIKLFVYLSDVATAAGLYEYIPRSHVTSAIARQIKASFTKRVVSNLYDMGITDDEMAAIVPQSDWRTCEGAVGTVLFSDPIAVFHHGKSRTQGRSALFFVYTAQDPLRPQACKQYQSVPMLDRISFSLKREDLYQAKQWGEDLSNIDAASYRTATKSTEAFC